MNRRAPVVTVLAAVTVLAVSAPVAHSSVSATTADAAVTDCRVTDGNVTSVTVRIDGATPAKPVVSAWSRQKKTRHGWVVTGAAVLENSTVVTAEPRTPAARLPTPGGAAVTIRYGDGNRITTTMTYSNSTCPQ